MAAKTSLMGKVIGSAGLIIGLALVFFYRVEKETPQLVKIIRPVKSLLVQRDFEQPDLYLPGQARANDEVQLSFEVPGQIIEKKVIRGQKVRKGEVLMRLDARDYANKLKEAQAALDRSKAHFDRISKALAAQAVSQEDFSNAQAAYQSSTASFDIARKALDSTELLASFDGVIADIFVDNFMTVATNTPILSLQDISEVQVEVNVPERYVVNAPRGILKQDGLNAYAVFDSIPNQKFAISFKEFTPTANSSTQTYLASFVMPSPTDVLILPGMTATIVVPGKSRWVLEAPVQGIAVPAVAVGVDSQGGHFVWLLQAEEKEKDLYSVHKRSVQVGERQDTTIAVLTGLEANERIAAAGVTLLSEGQQVRLLNEEPAATAVVEGRK
ncbi:MAG: efflux RND transporter periplasmic adaptor subunit [Lentisphaeria bacterium]